MRFANEDRNGSWVYRISDTVTRALDAIGMGRNGVPFFRPEIVLLYKSSERSPKNDSDFAAVAPHFSPAAALWLQGALTCDPQHPWLARLSNGRSGGTSFTSSR